jgi:imidazolonepropionase-like amidohydrolase
VTGGGLLLATVVAFRGATLVPLAGPPLRDSLIVVSGPSILTVTPATREELDKLPRDAEIVDLSGRWVVAGLIDAHVHAESDEDLRQMLRWGVTTVRLMAEDVAAARDLTRRASGADSGMPDIFMAAPIFTTRGGWWGRDEPADRNLDRFPSTPDAARRAVRDAYRLGSREIKVMLDDMTWCRGPQPPLPKVDPVVLEALVVEARRLGMRATVHAPEPADAFVATEDATALAHGVLGPLDPETLRRMKERPIYYIPTMGIFEFLADARGYLDSVLADPIVSAPGGVPAETVARYRSAEYAAGYRTRYPNFESLRRRLPALRENLRKLHASGIPIALGTDMWAFPGVGVSVEMELYVKAGLKPQDALRAATETAAKSLGLEDRGALEPGRRADFVVLSADPLTAVGNVRKIEAVYKAGRRVGPTSGAQSPNP